jgi:hypothetical protein
MSAFDVATAIAAFVADPARSCLELPHMTTGERKSTKKMLEQYAELSCESYGFGPDRQLHVFKKGHASNAQQETEKDESSGVPSIVDMASKKKSEAASPDRSTAASSDGSAKGSPAASDREILVPDLQVRNTFIHYEAAPSNERAVQSMPHGMFRQCILAESSQPADMPQAYDMGYETASEPEDDAMHGFLLEPYGVPSGGLVEPHGLPTGTLVVIEGLQRAPAFNGRSGVVQDFDDETQRYSILLASADACQLAKVKEDNLRVVLPCP